MKKICFVTDSIADIGGRQRINAVIANALAERKDLDVSILFTASKERAYSYAYPLDKDIHVCWDERLARGKKDDLLYKAFRYINKNFVEFRNTEFLRKIYFPDREIREYNRFFKENIYDTVIGVGTRPSAMISLLDIRANKIGWMHNSYAVYFEKKGYFQWKQERLYKTLLTNLDTLIVLTDGDAQLYDQKLNIRPNRIYNPLTFCTEKVSPLDNNNLVFVGRLDYALKGLDLLVEILQKLNETVGDFSLTVVGDGSGRERFENEVNSAGLACKVKCVGFSDKVEQYYLNSSVALLTSRQEGFGLVVTEAMECGVPIVSFKTEGPSEIINDGINGFLIDNYDVKTFADRVAYLCKDKTKRTEMGLMAKRRAADFSVEHIVDEWISVL